MAEDKPPVDPNQGDMFPEAIREGIGTLVEYAPKVAKAAGRGVGDLVRSEPVSPPELATEPPPTDELDFVAQYSPVYSHNIPKIAGKLVEQLYSPEQTAVNRADLFMIPEKMGETAPRISKRAIDQLLNDLKHQIDVKNLKLELRGKEVGTSPPEEIKGMFSQKFVVDRLVDFIRNEANVTDPEQLQRMVTETVMTTKSKMDPTEPQGFEFGGVAGINQDRFEAAADRLRNTSPETFFSDMRELMKSPRVEGREYGDVLPFISRERVDMGPEGIDTTYYLDSGATGIAGTLADKVFEMGEKATDYFYPDSDSKVENYAKGGVVTLKDRAVNMNRGPRSNGIMQYVPYITGATNGY